MRIACFAVSVLFLMEAAFPAAADPAQSAPAVQSSSPDPSAPGQPPAAADPLDQVVCKTYAPATGSRLGARKECFTVRQWKDLSRISQDYLNTKQMHALTECINPSHTCGG